MKATLRHLMIAACLAGLAHATPAQTVKVAPSPIVMDASCDLYRGTTIVRRGVAATPEAFEAAVRADSLERKADGNYTCRLSTAAAADYIKELPNPEPVCAVPRPADSQTVHCTAPQTGSWAQSRAVTAAAYPTCWTTGAWTPTSAPAGACSDPPPPVCTNQIPAPESRTQACPAGTTGNPWTQTSSYTRGEPPGCTITQGPWLPSAPPAGACTPIVEPPPPTGGPTLHFAPDGANSNPGTLAAPKRDTSGTNLSALACGTTLLFKRGGVWNGGFGQVNNPNTSAACPLTFDAYGTGDKPEFRNRILIEFGKYQDALDDGGYVIRNLKTVGPGNDENTFGVWLRDSVSNVVFENFEVSGYGIGIHMQGDNAPFVRNVTVRNSHVHRNLVQGIHGKAGGSLYENNLIELNNGASEGSNRNHGMYLSGGNGVRVIGNRFVRNSRDASGTCRGGNMTFHGTMDGLLVEGNTIEHDAGGCYGISITAGYMVPESFRNTVVRGNTIINTGACAICVGSAPGIVIDGNRVINTQPGVTQEAIWLPASGGGDSPGDAGNEGAVIRNTVICGVGNIGRVNSTGGSVTGTRVLPLTDAACAR